MILNRSSILRGALLCGSVYLAYRWLILPVLLSVG